MLKKSTEFIWISVIVFIAILYLVLHVFVTRSFVELEKQDTADHVNRLISAIGERIMAINSKASDWAAWDDAYQFVIDRNSRFIRSNFALSAFTGNNLNLIAYTNTSKQIVYARWYNTGTNAIVPIPENVRQAIFRESRITDFKDVHESISGILMLKQGPMLFASRPVVTSDERGPIRGSLTFGQLLDSEEVQSFSRITLLPVAVNRLDSGVLPADFARARTEIKKSGQVFVTPLDKRKVAGYGILNDIYGKPALMLRVELPRSIYNRGLAITDYTLIALSVLGILFGLIGSLLLARTVRKEHEFDLRTREFYRSTIEVATDGKLIICDKEYIPIVGELLGKWDIPLAENVAAARNEITEIANQEGMKDLKLMDFTLCIGESITNAVKHGGGGVASLYRHNKGLLFVVTDQGPGIEALAIPELALKPRYTTVASLGVGYKVMISLSDKVYLATGPEGTTVAMEKNISEEPTEEGIAWIPDTWGT